MKTPPDVYLEDLHFGLVEVVYEWARGMPFAEITGATGAVDHAMTSMCVQSLQKCWRVRL